ncbi:MAG: STAS domain-containing protein [Candidatus Sulfotelmatobacter sp.]|jgi:anti-anti-sigma factor
MSTRSPVIVMELPETLNHATGEKFVNEIQPLIEVHRPRIVLDCSQVQQMDSAGIETLLYCMQEAMKRDGDLKLAAVSPAAATIMELMRVDRLFEVFETADQATRSFQNVAMPEDSQSLPWYSSGFGLGDLKIAS